jgi:hypothetical protein
MARPQQTHNLSHRNPQDAGKVAIQNESNQSRDASQRTAAKRIKARKRSTLKLGLVSFFVFPISVYLLTIASTLAVQNELEIPLQLVGGLALVTLAGIGKFWQKKYHIGLEQMAGAIAIGTTLSLMALMVFWVVPEG